MLNLIQEEETQPAGKRLLLPAVSVGGTGQLAIDLLLNDASQNFKYKGFFYTSCFAPYVCNSPISGNQGEITFPVSLYENSQFLVIQIRSTALNPKDFCKGLVEWALSNQVSEIVVLASNSDLTKPSPESPQLYYMKNSLSQTNLNLPFKTKEDMTDLVRGIGLSKYLLLQEEIPVLAVFTYSPEVPADYLSCFGLAEAFCEGYQVVHQSWQAPWDFLLS